MSKSEGGKNRSPETHGRTDPIHALHPLSAAMCFTFTTVQGVGDRVFGRLFKSSNSKSQISSLFFVFLCGARSPVYLVAFLPTSHESSKACTSLCKILGNLHMPFFVSFLP
jgi:hypothetical protein